MKRRDFLCAAGAAAASTFAGRLWAADPAKGRFLLVFLRGGYDCASLLVPYSSSDYYATRPKIAIARPDPQSASGALALDSDWALAPAVRDPLGDMYKRGELAFIPFAGTEDLTRSHFETQDSIELGQPLGATRNYDSGFLARLAGQLTGPTPIAFTDALPLSFKGSVDIPNISVRSVGKPAFDDRQSALLASMYAGNHLEAAVTDGLELRKEVSQSMQEEMTTANRGAITTKGFAMEADRIGRLMRDKYGLGFVDIGGWDTHVNQGSAQGNLANNLQNLAGGLSTLANTLGSEWRNTVVVVVSEFGRTFRENGNGGTDHGHGSVYWVLGGSIQGGQIAGRQQRVAVNTLFQNRDYPVLNEYRSVLGGMFRSMWSLSPDALQQVFPGTAPLDLQLV
jgi:uncharacterized protein (DUF1501 family)